MLHVVGDDARTTRRKESTLAKRVISAADHREIPLGTIAATVGIVVVTGLVLLLAWVLRVELLLVGAALFIAVLLSHPVGVLQRRGLPRSLATSIVYLLGIACFGGIIFLLGSPLVSHVEGFAKRLPTLVSQAEHGKGPFAHLIAWLHLQSWVKKNAPKLSEAARSLAKPALSFGAATLTTIVQLLTIAVIAFFLLLDLPRIWEGFLSLLPEHRAARVDSVSRQALAGVSGYMAGNVLTSVIAGIVVYVSLLIFGVPFAGLLAVWVALVDFLPLIGALIAGVPTVLVALAHSTAAFIGVGIIFLVYWQVENHVLNPLVMSRTVRMRPLMTLLSVVVGAALGGQVAGIFGTFIGALVGIPIGSAIQVIVRELRGPAHQAPARTAPDPP